MRRAKIVCTLGPSSSTPERIKELVVAGLDVARFNLSHGDYAFHEANYRAIRSAGDDTGRAVGVMVDLQGPKIRTTRFSGGPIVLAPGQRFTITTREVDGTQDIVGTTYKGLPGDVSVGDTILIDDGKLSLTVEEVTDTDVTCVVVYGGPLSNNKGINLPGVAMSVPALSPKDEEDLRWALHLRADYIALSFVRSPTDLDPVHRIMDEEGVRLPVIAKIEKPQAVDRLAAIIDAFDGVMVARGDLGVEMPLEDVPLVQKQCVEMARRRAKPVIVATQVLESMIENSRPTRAEASDAANAVLDGADALMLSGETAAGRFPVEAVQTMARIIESTEEHGLWRIQALHNPPVTKGGVVCQAAAEVGEKLGVKFLITFTQSGGSSKRLAQLRPSLPMLAFTPLQDTRSQLALVWGVETYLVPGVTHTDQMAMQVDEYLLAESRCAEGEDVVIVAGSPPGIPGSTNALRVHTIGDAKNRVAPAYGIAGDDVP
ncbi:Pyruvate kinase [Nostocoides japonicum T1-X7]|uniref:Pyruvate kinase n=1 Tax=Nostocoides japonicum T1-X7 TaxID=1194083 RepID=A0A077M073_9MICO|nr:pyruvate kinase [Tetrasphaera japonica]CCH79236.1 Pyruvate kinase [Tetrasphaera japonica T1-X7]